MSCPDAGQGGKEIECIKALWVDAVDKGHDQEFMEAAWRVEQETPYFFQNCHNAAHETGRYAAEFTGESAYWLLRAQKYPNACGFGFVHGVTDAFALSRPGPAEIAEFLDGCKALGEATRPDCADGVGHGFWQAYKEVGAGVSACELFSENRLIASCVAGLGMQQFNPSRDGLARSYPAYLAPLLSPGLCRQQAELAQEEFLASVGDGCGSAAALTLGLPGTHASFTAIEKVNDGADMTDVVQELANEWNKVIDLCVLVEDPAQKSCVRDMALRVYWAASGTDSPLRAKLCPLIGYPEGSLCYNVDQPSVATPSPRERAEILSRLPRA